MKITCVIPARFGSSRFPGKPLADICGKPMLWWVYQEAKKLTDIHKIFVATESAEILRTCEALGMDAMLTSDTCASGTDRVAEVAQRLDSEHYLIWMGDEPLIKASEITHLITQAKAHRGYSAYMLAKPLSSPVDVLNPTTIKLAFNKHQELIFMSRSPIPFPKAALDFAFYKNIGAYMMSKETLDFFQRTAVGSIESIEEIELLRLLENHHKIFVALLAHSQSISVDTPKDLQRAIRLMSGGG